MDSCRSLLIGLLAPTLIPFIHSHDSSQSDLDKMTEHIIHLPHCPAVPWPPWNPGWSWITQQPPISGLHACWLFSPQCFSPRSMHGSLLHFLLLKCCFLREAFPDHPIQNSNFISHPYPYPHTLPLFSALFFWIFLVYFIVCLCQLQCALHEDRNFICSAHCCIPKCLEHCQ